MRTGSSLFAQYCTPLGFSGQSPFLSRLRLCHHRHVMKTAKIPNNTNAAVKIIPLLLMLFLLLNADSLLVSFYQLAP
jgi:hypothetical protein